MAYQSKSPSRHKDMTWDGHNARGTTQFRMQCIPRQASDKAPVFNGTNRSVFANAWDRRLGNELYILLLPLPFTNRQLSLRMTQHLVSFTAFLNYH